jgi:hypothetical protein
MVGERGREWREDLQDLVGEDRDLRHRGEPPCAEERRAWRRRGGAAGDVPPAEEDLLLGAVAARAEEEEERRAGGALRVLDHLRVWGRWRGEAGGDDRGDACGAGAAAAEWQGWREVGGGGARVRRGVGTCAEIAGGEGSRACSM